MSVIRLLDKHVAELIAAGEVVDRPASVIKELVENSIDAGAKNITVEIKNGGITFMRVTDDGCGITKSDVKTAFLRHATSKIKESNDLDSISTLGFRGEALASICAVSKVTLLTKTKESEFGVSYTICGGEGEGIDDAGCPDGTTVIVKDLFYNTPARMKFLKKDVTEGIAVAGIVDKIAISNPHISFKFIKDCQEIYCTDGDGDWISSIRTVCGKEFADSLVKVEYSYENFKVSGFVSKPICSRKNRSKQFFFINNRFVKSLTMMAALEDAYKNTIMTGKFPACVLNIQLPNDYIDVNVHPSKTEVRFFNEKPVYYTVYYGVKSAIENNESHLLYEEKTNVSKGSFTSVFAVEDKAEQIKFTQEANEEKFIVSKAVFSGNYVLNSSSVPTGFSPVNLSVFTQINDDLGQLSENTDLTVSETKIVKTDVLDTFDYKIIGEAFNTYIICQTESEIIFIDKHAAHERILYNSFVKENEISQQMLLTPVVATLSKEEYAVIMENLTVLSNCGFDIEDFGIGKIIIRAVPVYILAGEAIETVEEIAAYLQNNKGIIITEKLDWIYHSIACRAAVKGGNHTAEGDNINLAQRVLTDRDIQFCPHGRPVLFKLSRNEIEKRFGRIQ